MIINELAGKSPIAILMIALREVECSEINGATGCRGCRWQLWRTEAEQEGRG